MRISLCSDRNWLFSNEAYTIYSDCMYRPTQEAYKARMETFVSDPFVKVFVCEIRDEKTGILILRHAGPAAEIVGIAVSQARRRCGIGREMIHSVMESEHLEGIEAWTDEDAVGFYRRCGFLEERMVMEYPDGPAVRWHCSLRQEADS